MSSSSSVSNLSSESSLTLVLEALGATTASIRLLCRARLAAARSP